MKMNLLGVKNGCYYVVVVVLSDENKNSHLFLLAELDPVLHWIGANTPDICRMGTCAQVLFPP